MADEYREFANAGQINAVETRDAVLTMQDNLIPRTKTTYFSRESKITLSTNFFLIYENIAEPGRRLYFIPMDVVGLPPGVVYTPDQIEDWQTNPPPI